MKTLKRMSRNLFIAVAVIVSVSYGSAFAQSSEPADKENEVLATLWVQRSGEYRALCYQAYNLAHMLLDRDLRNHRLRTPRAVIVDLDETVWSTSTYAAMNIKQRKGYPEGWGGWMQQAGGTGRAGVVEFLN